MTITLPQAARLVRTTPTFTEATVPPGLTRAHHTAPHTWGVLRVLSGELRFIFEDSVAATTLGQGDQIVIPPERPHHVDVAATVSFVIDFHTTKPSETHT